MKGIRETKASPKADLLVCFPSRAHLTLMPKPICSPGRPPEPNKHHHNTRHHNNRHLRKSSTSRSCGQASPLLWGKTEIAEPTSPKVTCAGKIKVRKAVMEQIEKIHNLNETKQRNKKKRTPNNWGQCLSFKKEAMQLLACFRGVRFDIRCFGAFNEANIAMEEEEEDEYEDEAYRGNQVVIEESEKEASNSVFSKWLMVLQENQSNVVHEESTKDRDIIEAITKDKSSGEEAVECNVPPPNALLLMRCRSAPVRSLLKEKNNEEEGNEESENREGKVKEKAKGRSLKSLMEENRKKENLLVMRYDSSDFYKISSSRIAKDKGTWILGGVRDPLSRSESWNK